MSEHLSRSVLLSRPALTGRTAALVHDTAGVLDLAQAANLWGSTAQHRHYLEKFFCVFVEVPASVRCDLARGDVASAARTVHKLAGAAANVALPAVAATAHKLASSLRDGSFCTDLIDALEIDLAQARAATAPASSETMASAPPAGASPTHTPVTVLRPWLAMLEAALLQGRPGPAEAALLQIGRLSSTHELAAVSAAIADFDFCTASQLARALALRLQSNGDV